ncbi:MAG: DJ-1/PfpI family protein [Solirubrobacteraceae bacterium]|jgi:transcriptional regulator GlxA family with amidase domain
MKIDLLLYDGFDELDAIGPYEVLAGAGAGAASGHWDVRLATEREVATITAAHGTRIQPHGVLSDAPDLLLVPGGGWIDRSAHGARHEAQRGELPRAIAARHAGGARLASVCTGAMLLASAGLLDGRPAITHHSAIEDLRAAGAVVIDGARVVDDGDIITCAGVTAGLDLALWIVERELGSKAAQAAAQLLEYERGGEVWRSEEARVR